MANKKIYQRYLVLDNETGKEVTFPSIADAAYYTAFFEFSSVTVYGLIVHGKDRLEMKLTAYKDGKETWRHPAWESFYKGKSYIMQIPIPKTLDQIRKATKPGAKRIFCDLAVQMGASVTR